MGLSGLETIEISTAREHRETTFPDPSEFGEEGRSVLLAILSSKMSILLPFAERLAAPQKTSLRCDFVRSAVLEV
jgi:hypothetical protein